jgi:tripartite-type tricarboxylate transporter receptor subunit TctC
MRHAPKLFAAVVAATLAGAALAQDYPNRSIRMVVPFPPAGGTDNLARLVVNKVSAELGQSLVIENRAGAGGTLGAGIVSKAEADGYTILLSTNSTHVIGPILNPAIGYDPLRNFTPVIFLGQSPSIMVVPNSLPVKSVREFIDYAKKNPGKLNFGSAGVGGIPHLSGERFKALAGIEMTHVPYKGTALAMPDLIAGRIDVLFDSFSAGYPKARDGQVRALGVSSPERSKMAPDVPTISEDLPGFVSMTWFGVWGPAGLPEPVVNRLNAAFNAALKDRAIQQQFARMSTDPGGGSGPEFGERLRGELRAWSKVIADAKISLVK